MDQFATALGGPEPARLCPDGSTSSVAGRGRYL